MSNNYRKLRTCIAAKQLHAANIALLLVITVLLTSTAVYATDYQTYVISTYGNPNELIAVVQGELHDGGTVSSYQDKLIVRASAADYARIRRLISQLDTTPSAVMLSLRVGNQTNHSSQGGQVNININRGVWIDGSYHNTQNQQNSQNSYQVRGLSGKPIHIGTRTLVSLISQHQQQGYSPYGSYYIRWTGQQWASLNDGIDATVQQLPNGQLQLNLHQSNRQGMATQELSTSIIVSRGQWVQVGELQSSGRSFDYGRQQSSHSVTPIWIKVD